MKRALFASVAIAAIALASVPVCAEEMKAEVIHWWTSGGEAAAVPKTWDDAFVILDKLKAGGKVIPLAFSGQKNWEQNLFNSVLIGVGGGPMWIAMMGKRDAALAQSAEFKAVAVAYKKLKDYVDAGAPGRNWNDATNLVIQGKAGMQIMGDWAKGEFVA